MATGRRNQSTHRVNTIAFAVLLLTFVYMMEAAEGGCENYGHSCWGSHGKRSYNKRRIQDILESNLNAPIPDWFMSSLKESALRQQLEANSDMASRIKQLQNDLEIPMKLRSKPEIFANEDKFVNEDDLKTGRMREPWPKY
uniref:Putative neuropeptide cchamide-1 n=1 Tax=Xenopsylla cheopis TaxID=163159 RepID=A0A6M2DWM4_XENCH